MGVVVVKPEDVRVFGANAALLLAQLEYWLKRPKAWCVVERDEELWVAKSRADWSAETGLSLQQVRDCLERLATAHVIVRERHLHGNRIAAFIRVLVVSRSAENSGSVANNHNDMGQTAQFGVGQKNQMDLGESTQIYTDRDCLETNKRIGVAVATHLSPGEISEIVSGKDKAMARKPKSVIGSSVSDMLEEKAAGRKQAETPVSIRDVSKPGQLELVFKRAWSETYEDFLPSFTSTQLGQCKQLILRCPRGVAGQLVDWAVRNWPVFVSAAVAREGAFGTPQLPTVGFLLRFVQTATNCWQENEELGGGRPPAEQSQKPAKQKFVPPAPEKIVDTSEKPMSLEEVAKLLGKKL